MRATASILFALPVAVSLLGCGDDHHNDADELGVGWACTVDMDCPQPPHDCDGGAECRPLSCLTRFTGGYCGLTGCTSNEDCPLGSACVTHDDGINYCFRTCIDKPECNTNRAVDVEANCSSSVTYVDPTTSAKACVPPSSGT